MDVNRPCDSGNSPLHVAVNLGNLSLVKMLLRMPDIEVNRRNPQSENATPLHLAVLHGKSAWWTRSRQLDTAAASYALTIIAIGPSPVLGPDSRLM